MRSKVTNVQLRGLEIIESNLCVFHETLLQLHLFYDCKIVDKFWNDVSDGYRPNFKLISNRINFQKLFGFQNNGTLSILDYFYVLDF